MKQSKWINSNLKPEHKQTTNRNTMGPTSDIDSQAPTFWNRLRRDSSFSQKKKKKKKNLSS